MVPPMHSRAGHGDNIGYLGGIPRRPERGACSELPMRLQRRDRLQSFDEFIGRDVSYDTGRGFFTSV